MTTLIWKKQTHQRIHRINHNRVQVIDKVSFDEVEVGESSPETVLKLVLSIDVGQWSEYMIREEQEIIYHVAQWVQLCFEKEAERESAT